MSVSVRVRVLHKINRSDYSKLMTRVDEKESHKIQLKTLPGNNYKGQSGL